MQWLGNLFKFLAIASSGAEEMVILKIINRRRYWLIVMPVLLAIVLPFITLAQSDDTLPPAPVILTNMQDKYPLGLHLELLADPTGQLTIADVASLAYNDQFIPSRADIPNFGYITEAIWVRFQVRNQANPVTVWRLGVEESRLGYVDLYTPIPDGTGFAQQQAGRFHPATVQDVPYRYGVFNLNLPPGQTQTIYLRVQSASPVSLPLTLWSLDAFAHHAQTDMLILGLFFGAILIMMGYNFFLFAYLRDLSYLYLTLFIVGFAAVEGLAHQYLWPAWPDRYSVEIAAAVAAISLILFATDFLDTKTQAPRLHTLMLALLGAVLFALIVRFFGESNRLLNFTSLVIILTTVVAGFLVWRRGYRPARYFLLAWLLLLGTLVINFLVNSSLLSRNPLGPYSLQIGMVVMMLLLSLALADRINLLRAETEQANRALRNSEHRLSHFLEAMPVGVAVYDTTAKLDYINQQARRLLNLSDIPASPDGSGPTLDEEITRTSPYVAGSEQPYPRERMPVARALQGEAATVDDMEVRTTEQGIRLEVWASPIFDAQGQLQYAIAAFQDITTRKKLELELRRHRDHLEELVAERTGQLSAFLDMTMLVSEARTLPQVVDVAVDRIMEFSHCQALVLHLLDDDHTTLNLLAQRGVTQAQQGQLQTIPLEAPLSNWLLQRQEPLLALEPDKAAFLPVVLQLDNCHAYIGVQLRAGEQVLGMLGYYRFTQETFSVDEVSLLVALAEQLGIIIENHRLRDQIQENAVVAERHRLARDLHDSITQSLYSINLFAHATRQAAEMGDAERLDNSINRVEAISQTALKEMRLLLYQLRPTLLTEKSLAEVLQLRFDSVERRLGIEVEYQVEGSFGLPAEIAEDVYWVAIETLNNSLKHAEASRVTVQLVMAAPTVALKIADNGRGFDPDRVNSGMGLSNIRERLEQLDGCLTIKSAPGAGTTIAITANVSNAPDNSR